MAKTKTWAYRTPQKFDRSRWWTRLTLIHDEDPTRQVREREILINSLKQKFKVSVFQKSIQVAAYTYLYNIEEVNLDMLWKRVKKTKKRGSLKSIKYVDMLIEYLRVPHSSLGRDLFWHSDEHMETMHKYVPEDKIESMKNLAWKRVDSRKQIIEQVLSEFSNLDDSIVTKDEETNTYPFMQAAENESIITLDLMYHLLRRNPTPIVDAVLI